MKSETRYDVKRAIPMIMIVFISSATMIGSFNIIAPQLAVDFHIEASVTSLLGMIAMLALGVASVIYATLSDYVSIKKLMLAGILLLNLGALLSLFVGSQNYYLLLASTAVMIGGGTCGSGLFIITATRYLPEDEHSKYFGFNAACVNASFALGILLGGFFATYIGWKFLFMVPLVSLFTIPSLVRNLPDESVQKKGRLDLTGLGLLALFTLLISIYLNVGGLLYLVGSALTMVLFFLHITICKSAFISIHFFKNRNYIVAVLLAGLALGIQSAFSFLFSFMAQTVHEIPLNQVSLIILPSYVIAIISGANSGKIVNRLGAFKTLCAMTAFLIAVLALCAVTLDKGPFVLGIFCCLFAGGCSMIYAPFMTIVVSTLKPSEIGAGIGFFNLMTSIGPSILIVLTGKMMSMEIMTRPLSIVSDMPSLYANILFVLAMMYFVILCVLLLMKNNYHFEKGES